jgi:hypothetical protein
MTVSFQDVVFAFDFSRIETVGGVRYLWDYGPNGFHFAFPGGAADPTPQLDGSLLFAWNSNLDLPVAQMARFYAAMPVGQHTYLSKVTNITPSGLHRIFSCENAASTRGLGLLYSVATDPGLEIVLSGNGAVANQWASTAGTLPLGYNVVAATWETAPRNMINQRTVTGFWAAGGYAATAYDAAVVPRIGRHPSAGISILGRIHFLALIRGSLASSDLSFYSRLIAEGSQKPFCWRAS